MTHPDTNHSAGQSLIHADGHVLAAVDGSAYAQSVGLLAGWAASRLGVELELLHAIDRAGPSAPADLSGALALGAQEALLAELAELDEQRARLAQAHGRDLLENLRAALASAYGITARGRQRHGALVDVLLEAEPQVRLFVIGKRGEHADVAAGHLGSNLERVVRAVHRPVLVASRGFRPVQRFAIAFDGSPTTRKCVEMVCASPLLKGLGAHLLMAGNDDATHRDAANWAMAQLAAAGFAPTLAIEPGRAAEVIARHVAAAHIDLLVMGAYGHSRIRTMILGSTTTELLRTCTIPLLLLR